MSGAASTAGSLHDDASGRGVKHGLDDDVGGAAAAMLRSALPNLQRRKLRTRCRGSRL